MNNYIDSNSLEFVPAEYKSGDVESANWAFAYGFIGAANEFGIIFETRKHFKRNNIWPRITVDSLFGALSIAGEPAPSAVDYKETATLFPLVLNEHQIFIRVETTEAISGAVVNAPVVFQALSFGFTVQ